MANVMIFVQFTTVNDPATEYRVDFGVVEDSRMGLAVLTVLEESMRGQKPARGVEVAKATLGIEPTDEPALEGDRPGYDVIVLGVEWMKEPYIIESKDEESPG